MRHNVVALSGPSRQSRLPVLAGEGADLDPPIATIVLKILRVHMSKGETQVTTRDWEAAWWNGLPTACTGPDSRPGKSEAGAT